MIETARFVNTDGTVLTFNDDDRPLKSFTTEVSMRMTEREKSQQHGIYPSNTYMGKRMFHCEGDLFAPDSGTYIQRRLDMIQALMPRPHAGFAHAGTLEMLFTGMSETLIADCTIDGYPELPMLGGHASRSEYLINFKSFDPRMYGLLENSVNVGFLQGENFGGLDFNFTFNFDFAGGTESVNDVLVVNSGNIETYPVVTFFGQCVDPVLTNTAAGQTHVFRMPGLTIPAGMWATADFLRRTVVMSDGTNLYNYAIASDWWSLEPAPYNNVVRFSVGSAVAPSHADVKWRNAYMI